MRVDRAARGFGMLACGLALACAAPLGGCSSSGPPATVSPADAKHPRLMVDASQKDAIRARLGREPFATLYQRVRDKAAQTPREPEPGTWDVGVFGDRADVAQANAFIAWLQDDAAAAARAKTYLLSLSTDIDLSSNLDDDIGIPRVLIGNANAWDLLAATPWLSADESKDARGRITTVARKFATRYLDDALVRYLSFVVTQNNHPLRAASALGYAALAFPDDPDATRWLDWATDQIDYLLGPKGHYVQADGGISEGPFYHAFGFTAVMRFLIALERNEDPSTVHHHTCVTRNPDDPWSDNACVEGEPFTLAKPLSSGLLQPTIDWSISLRRPSGTRANLDDARRSTLNGAALATSFGAPAHVVWDWQTNAVMPLDTSKFDDLSPWYLAYVTDAALADAKQPAWRNRFFPASGHATFRSGWGTDDRWLLLVGDHGPARKSLHNHADGTSFAMAAYGDDLLIDTGYYKPDPKKNPLTTDAPSHNVVLVDGKGAPTRGLLNDWGDTDAFLENTKDGEAVAWADARTAYEGVEIRRGVAFVRKRYFVVADRLTSGGSTAKTFQWRAHLWAGHEAGGAYALLSDGFTVDRDHGGLAARIAATTGAVAMEEPPFASMQAPFVHSREEAEGNHAVVDAKALGVAPGFLVVLAPYAEGKPSSAPDGPLTVQRIDAGSGAAAWSIAGQGWLDVAWLRDPGASGTTATLAVPGGPTVTTDATFVLVARDGAFALVAGGSTLTLDGTTLVSKNAEPVLIVGK
jgi:hypothetical protein